MCRVGTETLQAPGALILELFPNFHYLCACARYATIIYYYCFQNSNLLHMDFLCFINVQQLLLYCSYTLSFVDCMHSLQ